MIVPPAWLEDWRFPRTWRALRDAGAYFIYALARFYRDHGMQAAGALTYTTLLALVPLMTIVFGIFSAFPAFQAVQERIELLLFENLVPEVGSIVREHLVNFTRKATDLTAIGVVALAVSAILLLSTIESTFNTIWRVDRERPLGVRLLILWTLLTLGPVLLGFSFSITTDAFGWLGQVAHDSVGQVVMPMVDLRSWGLDRLLAAAIQTVAFTALFLLVPARPVRLRDAAIGGAVAGVSLEVLKWGFRLYLIEFPTYQTIYGALAVVPIFLIWLYLSWTVVIIGAVFAASFPEWWSARGRRVDVPLGPPRRLEAAVMILAVLARESRAGCGTPAEVLSEALPLEARQEVVEALRQSGYLVVTDDGGYALTRDLRTITLAALARDIGLTLGLDGHAPADAPERRVARRLDAATGRLAERLAEIYKAEERILGIPITEVLGDGEGKGTLSVVTLPQGTPPAPRAGAT